MIRILWIPLFLCTVLGFSQEARTLKGYVVAEDLQNEAITIYNQTRGQGTITTANGFFEILVHLGDTLLFSSVRHQQKRIVVNKRLLEQEMFKVSLVLKVNELDEVRIGGPDLSGDVSKDLETIKTYEQNLPLFNANELDLTPFVKEKGVKTIKNHVVFDEISRTPVDILAVYRMVSSLFKKKERYKGQKSAAPTTSEFYNESFIMKELGIPKERVQDFFWYIGQQPEASAIVTGGNDLEVIEYLTRQSKAFKKEYVKQ